MGQTTTPSAVYFVDSAVAGDALNLGIGDGSRVFVLEKTSDAFLQMEAALASLEGPVDAVHVYSHGAAGALVLGGKRYDENALQDSADKLEAIGRYLKEGADILLYACNAGAGSLGESFLERFARLTGADVAASDDITGKSGDWELEKHVGTVETDAQEPANFNDNLDAAASAPGWGNIFGTDGSDTLHGFVSNDRFYGHGGADIMIGGDGNDAYIIDGDSAAGAQVLEDKNGGTDTVFSRVEEFDLSAEGSASLHSTTDGATATDSEVEYIVLQAQDGMEAQNATGNDSGQTILGNALSNNLTGKGGNDYLDGGDGDDFLDGGNGNKLPASLTAGTDYLSDDMDTLVGGKGNDSYIVRNEGDVVVEKANEGTDHVFSFIDYTLGANVENLTLLDGAEGGTQAEVGEGNALNNELRGNSAANTLYGLAGNDTLYGSKENEAADILDGGAGNDAYYVFTNQDTIIDSAGNDSIFSTADYDLSNAASVENLYLSGDAVSAAGNALNNYIRGNLNRRSTLSAGSGGANTLEGGSYDDHYILTGDTRSLTSSDVVIDSGGENSLESAYTVDLNRFSRASIQSVQLTGSGDVHATARKDVATSLTGNAGSNRLTGGNEGDTLDGGAGGRDTLIGGAGDDVYIVRDSATTVTEAAGGGNDTVYAHTDYTLAANVENVVLQDEARSAAGNNLANIIDARGISGGVVLHGGVNSVKSAGDTLIGGSGKSTIYSYNAADSIRLHEDSSDNVIYVCYDMQTVPTNNAEWASYLHVDVDTIGQVIYLGDPTRTRGDGASIIGSSLVDNLMGTVRNDTLTAGEGVASTLNGGAGADLLQGSTGADLFYVDNAGDSVHGGSNASGQDTVLSGVSINLEKKANGMNQFSGSIGTVELQGSAALTADGWADRATTLIGNAGANKLTGGSEGDYLAGGLGNDNLAGGGGNDTLVADGGSDIIATGTGRDTVLLTKEAAGGTVTVTDFDASMDIVNDADLKGWTRVVTQNGKNARVVWTNPDNAKQTVALVLNNTTGADIRFGQSRIVESGDFSAADVDGSIPWAITATGTGQTITGGNKEDTLKSTMGGNRLIGGDGADILTGVNNDTLSGGAGNDSISVSGETDSISVEGGAGDDEINIEKLAGSGSITGGDGKDTLYIHGVGASDLGPLSVDLGGGHHDEVRLMGGRAELGFDGTGAVTSLGMGDATADAIPTTTVSISGVGTYVGTTGADSIDAALASQDVHYVTNGGNDTFIGGSGGDDVVVSNFRAADAVSLKGGSNTDSVELRSAEALGVVIGNDDTGGYTFNLVAPGAVDPTSGGATAASASHISGFEQLTLAGENTDDVVKVNPLFSSSPLEVKTGSGNDLVSLHDISGMPESRDLVLDGGTGRDTVNIGTHDENSLKVTLTYDTLYGEGDTDSVLAARIAFRNLTDPEDVEYTQAGGVALGNFEVFRGSQTGTFYDASAVTAVGEGGLSLEGGYGAKNRFVLGRLTEGSVSMQSSGGESSDFLVEQGLAGGSLYMQGGSNVRDVFRLGNVADGASVSISGNGGGDELRFVSAAGQNGVNLALNANGSVRSARFGNGAKTNGLQGGSGITLFEGGDGNDTIDASAVTGSGSYTLSGGMGANQIKTSNAAAASTRVEIAGQDSVTLGGGTDTLVLSVEAALRGGEVYVSGFNASKDHLDESALINDGWSRSSAVTAGGKTSYAYRKTVEGVQHTYTLSFAGTAKPLKDLMTVQADDPSAVPATGTGGNLTTGAAFSGYLYGSVAGDTLNAAAASGPVSIYGNGGSDEITGSKGNDSIVVQAHNPEDAAAANPDTVRIYGLQGQGTRKGVSGTYMLADGNDTIRVAGEIRDGDDYSIEGGTGNDSIAFDDIRGGTVRVWGRANLKSADNTGTNHDTITAADITGGVVELRGNGGNNVLRVGDIGAEGSQASTVTVQGSDGTEQILEAPYVRLTCGDGNDSFTVGNIYYGNLYVDTDNGHDTVTTGDIHGGHVTLHGHYFGDTAFGNFTFKTGDITGGEALLRSESGNDKLSLGSVDGPASVTVQAGAGADSISLAGGSGSVQLMAERVWGTRKGTARWGVTDDGNDTITVGDISGGSWRLEGGLGNDSITVGDISGGTVLLTGRATSTDPADEGSSSDDSKALDGSSETDNDTLRVGDVSGGSLTMEGNGGKNTLSVGVISGMGSVYLEGGHGGNTFYVEAVRDGSLDVGAEGNSTITVGDIAGGSATLTARTYDDDDAGSKNTISVGQVSGGAQVELYGTKDNTNTFKIAGIDANSTVRVNGNGYIDWQGQSASPEVSNPQTQTLEFTDAQGVSVTGGSLVLENISNVQGTKSADYIDASTRITPPSGTEEYAQPFMAVHGNDGNDTLVGRSGQLLTGGVGDDLLMPTETWGNSWVRGGNGNDTLSLERLQDANDRNMSLVSNAPYYNSSTNSITNYNAPGLRFENGSVISMAEVENIRLADAQGGGGENHLTLAGKVTGTTIWFGSATDTLYLDTNAGGSNVTIMGFDKAADSIDFGDSSGWEMLREYPDISNTGQGTTYTYRRNNNANDTVSVYLAGVCDFSRTNAKNASTGAGQTHTLNTASWYKGSLYGDTITVNLNGDQPFYVDANGAKHSYEDNNGNKIKQNRDYVSLTATGDTHAEHVISSHNTDTMDPAGEQHTSSHSRLYVTGNNVKMVFTELDLSSDAEAQQVEEAVYDSAAGGYKVAGLSAVTTSGHTADNLKVYGFGGFYGTAGADYADARGITNTELSLEYYSNGGADTYLGGAAQDYVHADSLKATDRVSMDGGSSGDDPYAEKDELILENIGGNKTTAVNITFAADGSVGGESGGAMKIGGQNANAVFTNFECYEIDNNANNVIDSSRVTKENFHIYIDGEGNDTMTAAVNQAIASGAGNDRINIAGAGGWNWLNPGKGTDIVDLFGAANENLFTQNGDGTYTSSLSFTYDKDDWGDGRLSFNIGTQDNGSLSLDFNTRYLDGDTLNIYSTALNNRSGLMASVDLGSVSTVLQNSVDGTTGVLTFTRDSNGKYKANA